MLIYLEDYYLKDKYNATMAQHVAHLLVIRKVIGSNLGQTLHYN